MNNLIIPPSPNWYETAILACAPDNTLIYGSRSDITIIYDSPEDQPSDVKIIHRAHSQKIISTNINRNWGQPHKLLVTGSDDNIVKLWDIETRKKKLGHNAHLGHGRLIGATFAGDDRVISVSEDGIIVVWNIPQNQSNVLKDVFGSKVTVTCISTCPHAIWLTAFGLRNGLVVVTDLRRQGKVLYKLRGHDKSVLSLSWCPAPVNIFPKDPRNYVGIKSLGGEIVEEITEKKDSTPAESETAQISEIKPEKSAEETGQISEIKPENSAEETAQISEIKSEKLAEETAQISEIKPEKSAEGSEGAKSEPFVENKPDKKFHKRNIWSNLKHVDDDELGTTNEENNHVLLRDKLEFNDYLAECRTVMDLIARNVELETNDANTSKNRVICKAKRRHEKTTETLEKNAESTTNTDDKTEETDNVEEVSKEELKTENQTDTLQTKDAEKTSNVVEEITKEKVKIENQVDILPTEEGARDAKLEETAPQLSADESNADESLNDNIKETSSENLEPPGVNFNKDESETVEKQSVGDKPEEVVVEDQNNTTRGETERKILVHTPEEEEEPRREFLLASSGKEGNIYIWRAGTDGRMQTFLSVPHKVGQRKSNKSNPDKLWIVLCWISPTVLLSSSKSAELIKWTLPKPKNKNKQWSVLHCDHSSVLFSIAAPVVFLNEQNWQDERELNAWTVGQDRLLLNTSLASERKNLACYPTLGNAECLALSPVDPNRLAIGTAEGTVKVWDLSRPNIKNVVMTNFYNKIQSKVTTLAWHPTNELMIAYGTLEGRVGCLDTNNKSKLPSVLPHYFKSQVHKIEWGPMNGDKEDLGLFAVAEGKLVSYSFKKSEKAPMEVDVPDDTFVYTFGWKPDYTMMLVGTKSGATILYSPELKIVSTHYFQHRLKDIYWHPDAGQSDSTASERRHWFASISNSKEVLVCNFQKDIDDGEKIVAKFEHHEDINRISWNPYTLNELVIASDDGTIQVWNVESNTVVSTYVSPNFEGVLSAIWSPIDTDSIISAMKDHTIRVWRISEHPPQDINELKQLRKKVIKEITKEQSDLLPKKNVAENTHEETPKTKPKNNLLPNFFYPKEVPQVIDDLRKLFLRNEGSYDAAAGEDNNCNILKVFGSKDDMLDLIKQNEIAHQEKGKLGLSNTLSLFKGDIDVKIKKAIDERRVNPWIISIAPMVSHKLWQSACDVYAQQLAETADSDPVEIATYCLARHKVEEAINALCQASMYREALTLAKCRLAEDDLIIKTIMERWAKYSVAVGNFESAAQCYISLKKYEEAASVLFRRSDATTLKFAVELAEKSGNEELHKAVLFRYNSYRSENGVEEKELPSKLDAVLKQHLENECNSVKANLVEAATCNDGKSDDVQTAEISIDNGTIVEHVTEKKSLNEEASDENLQAAD